MVSLSLQQGSIVFKHDLYTIQLSTQRTVEELAGYSKKKLRCSSTDESCIRVSDSETVHDVINRLCKVSVHFCMRAWKERIISLAKEANDVTPRLKRLS